MSERDSLAAALAYATAESDTFLEDLKALLRIPSVSTQPRHTPDVQAAADWLAGHLGAIGLENVEIVATARHPLVYADWLHAGPDKPTVLIYGHYDVQPAEPLDLWESPPFEPEIRGDYLYARGASDDKGQTMLQIKALQSYLGTTGRLPLNVKIILEGEEECGGASLTTFVSTNQAKLNADVGLISDTAIVSPDQPAIVYGLRGLTYILVDVTGPRRDLHSGSYGGGVNNPLNALAHIITRLQDDTGRVLIPGFYDNVRDLSAEERGVLADFPFDEAAWLQESGVPEPWGEPGFSLVERLGARPTLDVNGIIGGYTGAGAKTVIPAHAHAKISMRLVADQDPDRIYQLIRDYILEVAPPSVKVDVSLASTAFASITDYHTPAVQASMRAYEAVFNKRPTLMREGGTLPVVADFQQHLGLETVLMGFGLASDNIHSPNERFYLPNFHRGVATIIHFFAEFGGA